MLAPEGEEGDENDVLAQASMAMDLIGWLTIHGFVVAVRKRDLVVYPASFPDIIAHTFQRCSRGLETLFPLAGKEARVLGSAARNFSIPDDLLG